MWKIARTTLAVLGIALGTASIMMPVHAAYYQFSPPCSSCAG
jgi:hypothetical protein